MRAAWLVAMGLIVLGCSRPEVTVNDAWVRAAPPAADTMAAFLVIDNDTDSPITITAVSSPWFRHAMFHRTELRDGVARMIHDDALHIAPGETLRLAPGGRHIMLMGPDRPVVEGVDVPLSLTLKDGRNLGVLAPVRSDR